MTEFTFFIPVICRDNASVTLDIPDELQAKLRKFITQEPCFTYSSLRKFLSDNSETLTDEIAEKIYEATQNFELSALTWDTQDFDSMDIENDLTDDFLMQALNAVRESGKTNMVDQEIVVKVMYELDYDEESETISQMSGGEYVKLLSDDFSKWLGIQI